MADAGAIIGAVGGIVGILSGGGVIQLWRTWRQERREQHHDIWATYEKSITTLQRQYDREADPTRKEERKDQLEAAEKDYLEQLEAYRQSSALRQSAPRGAVSATQPALTESEVARLRELLEKGAPLSAALLTFDDYFSRGNAFHAAGELEKALEQYNRALDLRPDDPDTLFNRGSTLQHLQRYREALADHNRALELRPDHPAALNNRGGTHLKLQRYDQALADFNRSLQIRPDHAVTLYNRACVYSLTGQLRESLNDLRQAISGDEENRKEAREDNDFDNLRSDPTLGPEFERLVAEPEE